MKMTTSWTDYLLCQLTSDKKLSTLECLPPEILDPILEEVSPQTMNIQVRYSNHASFIPIPLAVSVVLLALLVHVVR